MSYFVAYNCDFGGFSLSKRALEMLSELKGFQVTNGMFSSGDPEWHDPEDHEILRHDPDLVRVIQELGCAKASGSMADLRLMEVQSQYAIREYDGSEEVLTPETMQWFVC